MIAPSRRLAFFFHESRNHAITSRVHAMPTSIEIGSISAVDRCLILRLLGPVDSSIRLAFTRPPSTDLMNADDGCPSRIIWKRPCVYAERRSAEAVERAKDASTLGGMWLR